MYLCLYVCLYMCLCLCVSMCLCVSVSAYICLCLHVSVCACDCVFLCVCVCVCVCVSGGEGGSDDNFMGLDLSFHLCTNSGNDDGYQSCLASTIHTEPYPNTLNVCFLRNKIGPQGAGVCLSSQYSEGRGKWISVSCRPALTM